MGLTNTKIKSLNSLKNTVKAFKEEGKKIVLANGGFDLLHYGHIVYLKEAKEQGDVLIVAVNSNSSIKKLKGEDRPIVDEKGRAYLIASLSFVDYVIIFNENTVKNILLKLKPDYHVKGPDYTIKTIAESEFSSKLGIETKIVGEGKNHSTTDIIKKVRKIYG